MPPRPPGTGDDLVLGVDSSTQSTKAVLVRAADGTVLDQRLATHPDTTEVDPRCWVDALAATTDELLPRVGAAGVAGQQHGMVALDAVGEPVRPALLWNDLRSADEAAALVEELGGPAACADAVGSVLVASFTVTKLRWLRDHEREHAEAVRQVLLPHDYLTWHLSGRADAPATDRGDASGTGYFGVRHGAWRHDIASRALGHDVLLPRVAEPARLVGRTAAGVPVSCGTGDNMAAALGLGLDVGDVAVSIGTSGVASAVSTTPTADPTGMVSGFADATGRFLPLVCTVNASRVLDLTARLLGVDHNGLARLALAADPGAGGLVLLPYLDGERTPNRPDACGTLHGLTSTTTREQLARAAVEGLLCSLADAVDHLTAVTGTPPQRLVLVGGGARNEAIRVVAPAVLGIPVHVPAEAQYVARGAARQAAWALSGTPEPPSWPLPDVRPYTATPTPEVRARYAALRDDAPRPPTLSHH
jgi:xylulokinase